MSLESRVEGLGAFEVAVPFVYEVEGCVRRCVVMCNDRRALPPRYCNGSEQDPNWIRTEVLVLQANRALPTLPRYSVDDSSILVLVL